MLTKRIIPCLDIKHGRVVKGVNFQELKDVDDPVALAAYYNGAGADELVFYDIYATYESRGMFLDVLRSVAGSVFIPLTVGGGVRGLDDFDSALKNGADKVSVNTSAIKTPEIIGAAAQRFGSQCVVLSMDVKRVDGAFRVFARGGRDDTGIDAVEWAKRGYNEGAGEIVVNSIDADGVKRGFDIEMLAAISENIKIPVVASGGAGNIDDFITLFKTVPNVDAGLAASIFHSKTVDISALKEKLSASGVPVRRVSVNAEH